MFKNHLAGAELETAPKLTSDKNVKDVWVYHAQNESPKHGEYVGDKPLKYTQVWPPISVAP